MTRPGTADREIVITGLLERFAAYPEGQPS